MKSISLILFAAVLATACTTIGDKPADIPPQLIRNAEGAVVWSSSQAFGPVPQTLEAKGNAVCATLDKGNQTYRALGYHPDARDLSGNSIPAGGFFCVLR